MSSSTAASILPPESTGASEFRQGDGAISKRTILSLIACALVLTAGQVILATLAARGDTWSARYLSLHNWDGGWYSSIVENGYRNTAPPANLAFFPAYPVAATVLARLLGASSGVALLLTSQTATFIFWCAVLYRFRKWQVGPAVTAAAVMLIFGLPGAFYMVASYAESLFTCALVLLVCLGEHARRSVAALIGASLAGYVMSATRIVGAPLAILPGLWFLNEWRGLRTERWRFPAIAKVVWPYAVVALSTAFGTLSYFLYCASRFGHWDSYLRARGAGWGGAQTGYSSAFVLENLRVFVPRFSGVEVLRPGSPEALIPYADYFISIGDISHLCVSTVAVALIAIPVLDCWLSWRRKLNALPQRAVFYAAAWLLLAINLAGSIVSEGSYIGFVRYSLYPQILVIIALVHAHRSAVRPAEPLPLFVSIAVFVISAIGVALQMQLCWRYTRAILVA